MHKSLIFVGFFLVGISVIGFIYGPLVRQEVEQVYRTSQPINTKIAPVDTEFGIIISKIGANSAVIENVDPTNSLLYQLALSKGVAHAMGSALPGQPGTVFIFAHSSLNFYEAKKYNSVFYLLHWLKPADEIGIVYRRQLYRYQVTEVKQVESSKVEYLYQYQPEERLILMTCWPPGTTLKRLLVVAKRIAD